MRILVTSDWHGDKRTLGVSRLEDVRAAVDQTVCAAINERVALYVFLGDLCDPDAGPIVLRCAEIAIHAAMRLQREGIDSVWLAGNHDVFEDGTGSTSLAPLRPFHGLLPGCGRLVVAEKPTTFELGEFDVICLPFAATSHTYDPEEFVVNNLREGKPTILLGHLHLAGVVPGEESVEMARGREMAWPREEIRAREEEERVRKTWIFGGHYHAGATYDGVHVPGSLVRFTFGEAMNQPSFLVGDLEEEG